MQFKKIMIGASLALSIGLFAACGNDTATKDTKESATKTTESSVDLNKLDLPQIKDFMIQGGDPKGDGTGGESIWKKGFKTEDSNQLYNIRGALSMARAESRSSNGSQFFIVTNNEDQSDGLAIQYYPEKIIEAYKKGGAPQLDGEYTVFGQVTEGMDVVDKIASGEVKDNGSGEKSTPTEPVKVTEVKVLQEPKK